MKSQIKNLFYIFLLFQNITLFGNNLNKDTTNTKSPINKEASLADGVVALVGKNQVLLSDIYTELDNLSISGNDPSKVSKCNLLENILSLKLMLHQADLDSVYADEARVNAFAEQRLEYFISAIGSVEALEKNFNKPYKLIQKQMYDNIENQMRMQQMQAKIVENIKVSLIDIHDFYAKIPKDSIPEISTSYEFKKIVLIPPTSPISENEIIEKLKSIRKNILENNSDFGLKALLYSQDPGSAKNRGRYPSVKKGLFVPEFEKVAYQLKEGEISQPFKTKFGYHIVKLHARRGSILDLSHILLIPEPTQKEIDSTVAFANKLKDILRKGELNLKDVEKYVKYNQKPYDVQISAAISQSGMLNVNKEEIEPYYIQILNKTKVNEYSPVIYVSKSEVDPKNRNTNGLVTFVQLTKKVLPHKLSVEMDYDLLKKKTEEYLKSEKMKVWMQEKMKETGVNIYPKYKKCSFKNNWNLISK